MSFDGLKVGFYAYLLCGLFWFIKSGSVQKTVNKENFASRMVHVIPTAFGFALIFNHHFKFSVFDWGLWPDENIEIQLLGLAITLKGLLYAVWARIHLGKNWSDVIALKEKHQIIRSGPYQFTRHPIYSGVILAVLGSAICLGKSRGLLALLLVFLSYRFKALKEERLLTAHFRDEYKGYQHQVKMLIPFIY